MTPVLQRISQYFKKVVKFSKLHRLETVIDSIVKSDINELAVIEEKDHILDIIFILDILQCIIFEASVSKKD